jgi:hypothetical protein
MIGTLVVSLPSKFTGGSFVVEHHDEKRRIGGSDTKLTLIAFYADCRHEVRPIKEGHRIVLTYNLIAEGGPVVAGSPETRADVVTELVRDFFETPLPPRWSSDGERERPDRLVYLLDHEYTQRGLAWNRLKNADAARAAALQEVARRLDCEILLALADVHETWTCEDDDYGYGYGRPRWAWRYDDDDDDDESEDGSWSDENGHELIELVDGSVELRHWIGPGSRQAEAIAARAPDDWSIGTALRCSCKLCTTLTRFLRAPGESCFEWPLAKERRKHVHGVIHSRDLPVLHKTRRTGRPFTLVLEKTAAVFERDAAERRLWAGELEWLEQTADAFGST